MKLLNWTNRRNAHNLSTEGASQATLMPSRSVASKTEALGFISREAPSPLADVVASEVASQIDLR